jgi:hypothetical protein
MKTKGQDIQFDKRGAAYAVLAVVLIAAFQAMYYLAPDVLARPLWDGATLTLAFLLGTLSLAMPVAIAWWMIRADTADGETFDTTDH